MNSKTRVVTTSAFWVMLLTGALAVSVQAQCQHREVSFTCSSNPASNTYCPKESPYPYTVVNYSNGFFYGLNNRLQTTLTGGTLQMPLYTGYWTHKPQTNDADADKFSSTITVTFDRPLANVRVIVSNLMNQAITYRVSGSGGGGSTTVTLPAYAGGLDSGPAASVLLEGDSISGFTVTPTTFSSTGGWSFFITGSIEFLPRELAGQCLCLCKCPAILPTPNRQQ
jgi:hypothetical protein